jgi:transaldolase
MTMRKLLTAVHIGAAVDRVQAAYDRMAATAEVVPPFVSRVSDWLRRSLNVARLLPVTTQRLPSKWPR